MSISTNCDFNGVCTCKETYGGPKCTECASGFVGFPSCNAAKTGKVMTLCLFSKLTIIGNNYFRIHKDFCHNWYEV